MKLFSSMNKANFYKENNLVMLFLFLFINNIFFYIQFFVFTYSFFILFFRFLSKYINIVLIIYFVIKKATTISAE